MRIGFVSTWFERGAAYVTRQYSELLEKYNNEVYIYARGEEFAKNDSKWNRSNVTWGKKLYDTNIDKKHFFSWIRKNKLDIVFFNEQREMTIVLETRLEFPELRLGTYIDYYTQNTVDSFKWYDFLICNTKRHYSVFEWHPQCYYVPWGTDTELFKPSDFNVKNDQIVFFHSAGMSNRKGTDVLIQTFIDYKLYDKSKLIIHTQLPIEEITGLEKRDWSPYNIEIIEKTVSAPGLYHLGDVYVYPTTLDGLGLTLYEALSMGMPVITTDCAPMNEIINDTNGRLVSVNKYISRWDSYYWPLSFVEKVSLYDAMAYYIDNHENISLIKENIRKDAINKYEWKNRGDDLERIFKGTKSIKYDKTEINAAIKNIQKSRVKQIVKDAINILPPWMQFFIVKNVK